MGCTEGGASDTESTEYIADTEDVEGAPEARKADEPVFCGINVGGHQGTYRCQYGITKLKWLAPLTPQGEPAV